MAEPVHVETEGRSKDAEDWSECDEWSDEDGVEVGGVWSAGRRDLTSIERHVLRRRAFWMRAGAGAAALAFPLIFFCALAAGALIEEALVNSSVGVGATMVLLLGGTFVLLLVQWLMWEEGGGILRALRCGSVHCFAVVTRNVRESTSLLDRALQTGLLQRDSPAPQTIELLTESDWIWRVNGIRPEYWRRRFPSGQ